MSKLTKKEVKYFKPTKAMTEDEKFGLEMQAITRRQERLQALFDGRAKVASIKIAGGWVSRHYRNSYTRIIIKVK